MSATCFVSSVTSRRRDRTPRCGESLRSLRHCLADDRGRPVAFTLTPGNIADISVAIPLLSRATPARRLLADKAYDADSLRNWLKQRRIKPVIPSTASRRKPYPLDKRIYRRRNVIERLFCRLKLAAYRH
ncbi:transposase [Sphingomonas sp. NPDC092331]|uniref:transposase n=1 Tax=unclassified Sphingomonas TaxID=196159 RepID=UPI0031F5B527